MEGYLIARGDIRVLHAGLTYDKEMSEELEASVFWFEGEITQKELDLCIGVAFSIEDIITSGLRMAKTVLDRKMEGS
jgi:hypothetical protein